MNFISTCTILQNFSTHNTSADMYTVSKLRLWEVTTQTRHNNFNIIFSLKRVPSFFWSACLLWTNQHLSQYHHHSEIDRIRTCRNLILTHHQINIALTVGIMLHVSFINKLNVTPCLCTKLLSLKEAEPSGRFVR